jgi:outer membrane autotransporter protein
LVVSGNRVATVDPTPFGLADKNMMDFTRAVSSILGSVGETTPIREPVSNAFAPENGASPLGNAFAGVAPLPYAGNDTIAFKNPTMVYGDGRSVWARGFVGERYQHADDTSVRAKNLFEGGAIGLDLLTRPDLRFGIFAGGGHSEMSLDLNLGSLKTDTVFGGIYGRFAFSSFGAPSYLDFSLHGGGSTNASSRNVNNNLLASGLENATATYNSGYVSPELTYGVKLPLWANYTLIPAVRLRYVAGRFDGYTEAGSTANLTVAGRTLHDFEQRGEIKLTHTTAFTSKDMLLTSVNFGVLGIERLGDNTINTVLLGQGLPFVTPGKNFVVGVFGGLGMEWRTRSGVSFFGAAEYIATTDQATIVGGRGGVRVAF